MGTPLLNDDGTASMATMLLLSHHAFRRDMKRFLGAIAKIKAGDTSHADAVRGEWEMGYRQALHGHHTAEDTHIFPDIRDKRPDLIAALDTLTAQHHEIDPVIERGDAAFADLADPQKAETVMSELKMLLDQHLAFEEANITSSLRVGKEFPMQTDESSIAMYAGGFAWSMQGIAPEVLVEAEKLLPQVLLAKLPAAREEFEERSKRVWGTYSVGSSTTSVPEDY